MTQAMQFSAFKGPFADRIDAWNAKLYTVSEVVEAWLVVQRNWLYLQPIFDSPDINKQVRARSQRQCVLAYSVLCSASSLYGSDVHWR
jgi:dynein heavy chain, axonemal